MREHGGWGDFEWKIIKILDENTSDELLRLLEQTYIDELKPTLNSNNSYIKEDKVLYMKTYLKAWNKKNPTYHKEYYKNKK